MNDVIHIRQDTRTHRVGDLVTVKQAAVLKKLGITPIESLIKIHFAWGDGEIIPQEILYLDINQFKNDVALAYREALGILFKMPFLVGNMTEEYILKVVTEANTINSVVFGESIQAPIEVIVEEKEAEEESEEDDEVGIGGLFG